MSEFKAIESLRDALPKEIARVRDEVLPAHLSIGFEGQVAVRLMRADLNRASKATIEGDIVEMVYAYELLKEYQL